MLTRLRDVQLELTQPSENFGRPKMGKASALSLPLRTAELVLGSRAHGFKKRARSQRTCQIYNLWSRDRLGTDLFQALPEALP